MPEKIADVTATHRLELAVSRLDSLPTLPCVAVQFLAKLLQREFRPAAIAEIIESDPALAAKIFVVMHQHGVHLPYEKFTFRQALDKLPTDAIRDAILSVKVSLPAGGGRVFEADKTVGAAPILSKRELLLHSLAVACCAEGLAEIMSPPIGPQLAYFAGLLHDIGKLALLEAMPKSFAQIVEEAKSTAASSCTIEKKHFGTDHTILGKTLARKWHLPEPICLAIWLHHSDTAIISQNMPEARIALLVHSADCLARQSGIGQSGSFDTPESIELIARSLDVGPELLEQISRDLHATVEQKSRVLGLDLPNVMTRYCDMVRSVAVQFAQAQSELSLENRRLQVVSSHLDFITDFLLNVNSSMSAIDIAENFATRWQRFYQTGTVCLYLARPGDNKSLEAIIVEALGESRPVILNGPENSMPIPERIANESAVVNAHDYVGWLFEQLDVDFDAHQTKLIPLLSAGKAVGAIVFELHYPGDARLFEEKFKATASVAGAVLDIAMSRQRQERFAEQFVQLISSRRIIQPQIAFDNSLDALAEMAAGVAHELNNPLSIISGRAQLLAEAERDQQRRQDLKRIQENASEVSAVIEELMSFAEPRQPRPAQTDISQILEEAIQLASQKTNLEQINAQVHIAEDVTTVSIDSAHIVSAIANVISNSVESYADKAGPIRISADTGEARGFVRLQISDTGCGMDTETLRKATHPFFSAKPAGRKRGMGLAYAVRLIQLNKGSLQIESEPGRCTTVTVILPTA